MRLQITAIAALVVALSLTMGTVGFSVLELDDRNANVQVAQDDSEGLLILNPGTSSTVQQNSNGQLEVDLGNALAGSTSATGVNPNSRLQIGDLASSEPAFTATNGYNGAVDIQLIVSVDDGVASGYTLPGNVKITDAQGNTATLSPGGSAQTITRTGITSAGSVKYELEFDTDKGQSLDDYKVDLNYEVTPN